MISTTVKISVSGQNYDDLVCKAKSALSNFFDIPEEDIESKINIEIIVTDFTNSLDFEDEDYVAEVVAKARKNV
jgi:hypothetical protein